MIYLLHRLPALGLAVLLVLSAGQELAFGREGEPLDPFCRLGSFSGDMLALGGRQVTTDDGLFYLGDEDGYIYNTLRGAAPVYAQPAARLNYCDGVLYFARLGEGSFDLCSFDPVSGEEIV